MLAFSRVEENYIKGIYKLQQDRNIVTTNALAELVNTAAASVTDMLKKLRTKKIIEYKKYYGFYLNELGKREALRIIRRHRLWEYFLVEKLGMEWNRVHEVAEELEHVSNPELIKRLDDFLEHPTADPHGDPIPAESGEITLRKQISLPNFPLKKNGMVSAVGNQSDDMLRMLDHYNINIGVQIKVLRHFDFDGSMEIKLSKQPAFNISRQVAQNIFVYDK